MKTLSQRKRTLEENLINQNIWINFYESDPGEDPENNDIDAIVWAEGQRFNLANWEITKDGMAYNLDEITVTNTKPEEASKIRHFVFWNDASQGEAIYKGTLLNKGAFMVKTSLTLEARQIVIKEE